MNKLWNIVQYGYLVAAAICLIEGFLRINTGDNKVYLFFGFAVVFIVMFFVKRKFRRKIEERNRNKQR